MKSIVLTVTLLSLLVCQAFALDDALKVRVSRGNYSDETVVRFLPQATTAYDNGFDALKLFSTSTQVPSLFTDINPQTHLSINALPTFFSAYTVVLHLKTNVTGSFTLKSMILGDFAKGTNILLKDLATGMVYDFKDSSSYSFTVQANTISTSGIFELVFLPAVTQSTADETCAGSNNGSLTLVKPGDMDWGYKLYKSNGMLVDSSSHRSSSATITALEPDYYFLYSGSSYSVNTLDTIIINSGINVSAAFILSQDTAEISTSIYFENGSSNANNFHWTFGDGHNSNAFDPLHSYDTPGTYLISLSVDSGVCSDTFQDSLIILEPFVTAVNHNSSTSTLQIGQDANKIVIRNNTEIRNGLIRLYDLAGVKVFESELTNTMIEVPCSGVYVLYVKEGESVTTKKILVKF